MCPLKLAPTDVKEAESGAEQILHIIRGVVRMAMGKHPDLPEKFQDIEAELPAYVSYLKRMEAPAIFGWN